METLRPVEPLYGESQHACDDIHTSGDQLLQKKVKVIIRSGTSSIQSESETQQDRFGVQTAGQHLSWKLLLLNSSNLISSWLKWLILSGTAWRHSSRRLSCVMSHSRVDTAVTQPPAACSGCSNQGHRAKRMMEVLQAAQHFTSGLEVSAAKPECPRRKKKNHFKRAQRKRETSAVIGHSGQSCVTDWCLQLLVQLRQLRAHPLL